MTAGFQPFLISEFKTGLFEYLEPWIRPQDAFQPLQDAFVYRGSIQKRSGYSVFGNMAYQDVIATGNGGKTYSGTLQTHPIIIGSFAPTDGTESFTDNGDGTLTGSAGGSGTINYSSGAWTLSFNANVSSGVLITASYNPMITRAIMGLKTWVNEMTGTTTLIALDTRRASAYDIGSQSFVPIDGMSQIIWVGDGSTTMITLSTGWVGVAPYVDCLSPYSISITDGTSTITDDGAGNLSSSGNFDSGGTVDYATGVIVLNFVSTTTATITLTATLYGDYFTGTTANFFNATNWLGELYLTNNSDPITVYDGTTFPGTLSRPAFPITQANQIAYINNIGTCLDLDVYKNRLLVQSPTIINDSAGNGFFPQSIRWSAILNPTNLVADVTGNGGELSAPTSDLLQASEFLRDQLIVFFTNTTWTFRFTGSDFAPFRFDKINASKSTNAPYGTIDYDERVTSMGSKGLIACDGVNVQRYDVSIIDEFLNIDQQYFFQCFGLRFDNLNQSWMLYPSQNSTLSNSVLVYNFAENTWGIYNIAMSCLGLYNITSDITWADFAADADPGSTYPTWGSAQIPWDSYLLQDLAPTLLGGGFDDTIYQMNSGTTDNGNAISASVTTTRWNPFVGIGQKVQFGYIDFYYLVESGATPEIMLTFFTDSNSTPIATRMLTLDGPANANYDWKRIYINNIGEFLQMNMACSSPTNFKILGMILWARPAGRFTP